MMAEETIFKFLVWFQLVRAILSFRKPVGIRTYGRHLAPKLQRTPALPPGLAWVVMESPALIVPAVVFPRGKHSQKTVPQALLFVFLVHYFQRTVIYPLRISSRATRMPVVTTLLGGLFNALNTYIQARGISHFADYPTWWLGSPQFVLGSLFFFTGMVVNIWADSVLISLRKSASSSSSSKYQVPKGGLYEWVSCPNYLGEIVEWLGWAVMTGSTAGLAFFTYTAATLAPRAAAHHKWYLEHFNEQEYPRQKKALVPFLY